MAKGSKAFSDHASSMAGAFGKMAGSFMNSMQEAMYEKTSGSKDQEPPEAKETKFVSLTCTKCGGTLEFDFDNIQTKCPYCGNALMIDAANMDKIFKEREKTKRLELEYEQYRLDLARADARRPGKIKVSIVLGIIGAVLFLLGMVIPEEGMLQALALIVWECIALVWLFGTFIDHPTKPEE